MRHGSQYSDLSRFGPARSFPWLWQKTHLIVRGAREHNLRNIDVTIPRDQLTVITGLSGSGKSSLAFDTIYAEGQRRYVESLSAYARQFLGLMEKPDVDSIEGLSPAISIEQKTAGHNPRSTVGTVTEIYDYLRLLWARAGTPHCPNCGRPVQRQSAGADRRHRARRGRATRVSKFVRRSSRAARASSASSSRACASRASSARYVDGDADRGRRRRPSSTAGRITRSRSSSIGWSVRAEDRGRLTDSIETALKLADGVVEVSNARRRNASSCSRSDTAARPAASRCPSSSRGTSRSTRRSAPARRAADSAPGAA